MAGAPGRIRHGARRAPRAYNTHWRPVGAPAPGGALAARGHGREDSTVSAQGGRGPAAPAWPGPWGERDRGEALHKARPGGGRHARGGQAPLPCVAASAHHMGHGMRRGPAGLSHGGMRKPVWPMAPNRDRRATAASCQGLRGAREPCQGSSGPIRPLCPRLAPGALTFHKWIFVSLFGWSSSLPSQ